MFKFQRILRFLLASLVSVTPAFSQTRVSLSTNFVDYVDGGTLNVDASVNVSSNWSAGAAVKYNPYSANSKQRSFSVGGRYWPWYVYSGWWFSGGARYQEFSESDIYLVEGDRVGAALSMGYAWMIDKHFNVELGWGLWGGYELYKEYGCQTCARIRSRGETYFVRPDQIMLSFSFIF